MLEGIRVLDFSRLLPGPFATKTLADLGAEVIKVENPKVGDDSRYYLGEEGKSPVFASVNAGKKCITLDLKQEEGQQLARRLAQDADVVVESFRPGVAERLGIGYAALKEVKPGMIYCSLTGYGQEGKWAQLAGHDINYIAICGILSLTGHRGGQPVIPGVTIADLAGGMGAVQQILAAIIRRDRSGEGAYLDTSMVDVLLQWQAFNRAQVQVAPQLNRKGTMLLNGGFVCYQVYPAKEGFVALGALEYKFWERFCRGVGREAWLGEHMRPARAGDPVMEEITALFRQRTAKEWEKFGEAQDCCLTAVWEIESISEHPLVNKWEAARATMDVAVAMGAHNWEVLEGLGLSLEEIDRLQEKGVI